MLTGVQERKQTHYFELVDVDNNGFIEPSDWNAIGKNLAAMRDIDEGTPEFDGIMETIGTIWDNLKEFADTDGDGKATLYEWLLFEDEKVVNGDEEFYDGYVNNIVRGVFQLMDADGNGEIGPDEYRDMIVSFGVAPRHAVEAFHKLDVNGDGHISEDELVQHVRDFHRSTDPETPGNWLFGPWQ